MKKIIIYSIYFVIIPLLLLLTYILYKFKQYQLLSVLIAILACLPFFINFEVKKADIKLIVIIAAFTALASVSRVLFVAIPGFNPATAIIILIALVYGKEVGFLVGALTPLISNIYLLHGPWTPFQMFSWGLVGLLAGLFQNLLKKNIIILSIFGIFAGALFSLIMDVYTVLSYDNAFRLNRYIAMVVTSLLFTINYIISNVIFLILFSSLFLKRLERIKTKYDFFL